MMALTGHVRNMRYFAPALLALAIVGCSNSGSESDEDEASEYSEGGSDEIFHGYECTEDCSGHEAGYQWAADNGVTDADSCGGNSQSFIEGCQAYAEENGF